MRMEEKVTDEFVALVRSTPGSTYRWEARIVNAADEDWTLTWRYAHTRGSAVRQSRRWIRKHRKSLAAAAEKVERVTL